MRRQIFGKFLGGATAGLELSNLEMARRRRKAAEWMLLLKNCRGLRVLVLLHTTRHRYPYMRHTVMNIIFLTVDNGTVSIFTYILGLIL
jgi:hypothetical protein